MRTLLLLAVVACARDPFQPLPNAQSRVVWMDLPQPRPRETDLLFVIDDSPAMAGFRADLATNAPNFMNVLSTIPGGLPYLHLAVTTSDLGGPGCSGDDGALRRAPAIGGDFIDVTPFYDHTVETDFTGSLADAFSTLADVGASGCATSQPLAAAKRALQTHPSFMRDDADLAIVFITANDDASPGDIGIYASWLRSAKPDPATQLIVAGIAGPPGGCSYEGAPAADASRLRTFLTAFPNRSTFTTICQSDLSDGLVLYEELLSGDYYDPCIEGATDPDRCVASDRINGIDVASVPQCSDANGALPCFRFDDSLAARSLCGSNDLVMVRVERHAFALRNDHVWFECEVE